MARSWDTEALIERVEHYTLMPANQGVFSNANITDILNEEMYDYIVPFLLGHYEDYLVAHQDYTITAGQTAYDLPTQAVGDKLKDFKIVYQTGEEVSIPRRFTATRYWDYTIGSANIPEWFEVRGNQIIVANPNSTVSDPVMRAYYYKRPAPLAVPGEYGKVASIATDTITYETALTGGVDLASATSVDIQKGTPFFDARLEDTATTSASTTTIDAAVGGGFSTVVAGDYVTMPDYAAIPQIPRELIPLLCVRVAINLLRARGLSPLSQELELKAAQLEKRLTELFKPRVDDETPIVFNHNSPLRSAISYRRWRWRS